MSPVAETRYQCAECGHRRPWWAVYNRSGRVLPSRAQAGRVCGNCLEHMRRLGQINAAAYREVAADVEEDT